MDKVYFTVKTTWILRKFWLVKNPWVIVLVIVKNSLYLLQVEFDFRSKWFNLGWCVISLYLVFIIIKRDKEITNQPRLKSCWPEIKLTCNISTKLYLTDKFIHSYTRLYTAMHGHKGLYTPMHSYTQLYPAILGYTQLYEAYTQLYTPIHR